MPKAKIDIKLKREIVKSIFIAGHSNTPSLAPSRTTRLKISKDMKDLNNTQQVTPRGRNIKKWDLTDISRTLQPTTEGYPFFPPKRQWNIHQDAIPRS